MNVWQGTVAALALVIIALSLLGFAAATWLAARKAAEEAGKLAEAISNFHQALDPILKNVKGVADASNEVTDLIRREAAGYAATSMRARATADEALQKVSDKVRDVDALMEVLYAELEETALDVGTMLHRARKPKGWLGRIKRLIGA
jgi:methyl-accepting chemotaxis protein